MPFAINFTSIPTEQTSAITDLMLAGQSLVCLYLVRIGSTNKCFSHSLWAWVFGLLSFSSFLGARHKQTETLVATIWLCADSVFLTVVISVLSNPSYPPGAILIGYPMIVVGGGMFFRARMIVFVTIASMLSYVALLVLEPYMQASLFQNAIFLVLLACMGICSLHQVRRFRMLSNYIETRRDHSF